MAIRDTDTFLVNQNNTSYRTPASSLFPKTPLFGSVSGFPAANPIRGGEVSSSGTVIFVGNNCLLRSANGGTSFTLSSNAPGNWMDVATDNAGNWLAVNGNNSGSGIAYSQDDGVTWTTANSPGAGTQCESVVYANGIWTIGTYNNYVFWDTTVDMQNFTIVSMTNMNSGAFWAQGLIYGNGTWLHTARSGGVRVATSTNGKNFQGNNSKNSIILRKGVYYNNNFYIGSSNQICKTPNGQTWTDMPIGVTQNVWDVQVSDSGRLWALAYEAMVYSDDGTNWTRVDLPGDASFGMAVVGEKVIVPSSTTGTYYIWDGGGSGGGGGSVQPTDLFLVNRNNTSYKCEFQNLKSKLQDSDLMFVNRNNTSYKVTGAEVKAIL